MQPNAPEINFRLLVRGRFLETGGVKHAISFIFVLLCVLDVIAATGSPSPLPLSLSRSLRRVPRFLPRSPAPLSLCPFLSATRLSPSLPLSLAFLHSNSPAALLSVHSPSYLRFTLCPSSSSPPVASQSYHDWNTGTG